MSPYVLNFPVQLVADPQPPKSSIRARFRGGGRGSEWIGCGPEQAQNRCERSFEGLWGVIGSGGGPTTAETEHSRLISGVMRGRWVVVVAAAARASLQQARMLV